MSKPELNIVESNTVELDTISDDATVIVIGVTPGYDAPLDEEQSVCDTQTLTDVMNVYVKQDDSPLRGSFEQDMLNDVKEQMCEVYIASYPVKFHVDDQASALYVILDPRDDAQRFVEGLQKGRKFTKNVYEEQLYPFTYTITNGEMAKKRDLELLDGGIANNDITGYAIG